MISNEKQALNLIGNPLYVMNCSLLLLQDFLFVFGQFDYNMS